MKLPRNLAIKLEKRIRDNSLRTLKDQNQEVDFSSNDYLGFSKSKLIYAKTIGFLDEKNIKRNGSTGSRLLSGNHTLFQEVEWQLSKFHYSESALIFNSGYDANLGLLASIAQRGDTIFYDEYVHASIRDGIQLSNAKAYKFRHNDLDDLERKIEKLRTEDTTTYIITESIFSMDGDSPDLEKLVELAKRKFAYLIIDEAHASGVVGENGGGLVQKLNLEHEIFARVHTFGKALGCHGAAILGSKKLIEYLFNYARPFIYSTALSQHAIANIIVAYRELETTNMIEAIQHNISLFKQQILVNKLDTIFIKSDSQIHCCTIKGNDKVKEIARKLADNGFDVKPILSPTVPINQERLRFCIHSYNSTEEIKSVLGFLSKFVKEG